MPAKQNVTIKLSLFKSVFIWMDRKRFIILLCTVTILSHLHNGMSVIFVGCYYVQRREITRRYCELWRWLRYCGAMFTKVGWTAATYWISSFFFLYLDVFISTEMNCVWVFISFSICAKLWAIQYATAAADAAVCTLCTKKKGGIANIRCCCCWCSLYWDFRCDFLFGCYSYYCCCYWHVIFSIEIWICLK